MTAGKAPQLAQIRHRGRETTLHYNKTATRRAPLVGRHPAPGIMHSQRHNWIDDGFTSLPQFGKLHRRVPAKT